MMCISQIIMPGSVHPYIHPEKSTPGTFLLTLFSVRCTVYLVSYFIGEVLYGNRYIKHQRLQGAATLEPTPEARMANSREQPRGSMVRAPWSRICPVDRRFSWDPPGFDLCFCCLGVVENVGKAWQAVFRC